MSKNFIDRSLSSLLEEETLESSMDHVSSRNIKKIDFDGKDYPTWKLRFVSLLLGLGLKGIIDGTADTTVKGYLSKRDYVCHVHDRCNYKVCEGCKTW